MREKTQSWVAYIIVGLLILSFALWGISSYFGGGQENQPVATVDGEEISYPSFLSAYHQFLQNAQVESAMRLNAAQEKYAKRFVLNNMIQRIALLHYITKLGFAVDQQEIDAALMAVPLFSSHGEFSPALFKRFLVSNGVTAQQFIADFSKRMMLAQWEEGLTMTSFSTSFELSNIISLLKQKRNLVYGIVKANTKHLDPITSAEAQQYYDHHQADFLVPEQVKVSYITLRRADIIKSIRPTDEELAKYYTQDASRFNVPERWLVDVIRVQSSQSVSDVTKQVQTALDKNNLSSLSSAVLEQRNVWLNASNLNQESKAALVQTSIGKAAPAIKINSDTYIVYKLLKHQEAENKQYSEVKAQVRSAYIDYESTLRWNQTLEEIADLAYEHPESLTFLAKRLNVKPETSAFFSQDYDGKTGIQANAEIVAAAFSDDVLSAGNNSEVVKLDQGNTICILRVVDHITSHEQSFTEVEKQVKQILLDQHAMKRAKITAEKIQQALTNQVSLDKIQKTYGIILSSQTVGRFDRGISNDILQQAFLMTPNHAGVTKVGDVGYAVLQVGSIIPGNISSVSNKERLTYKNVIANEWAQVELSAYVRSIVKSTKIKINEDSLEAVA